MEKASPGTVEAMTKEEVAVLIPKGQGENVTFQTVFKEGLKAPLKQGDPVGEMLVYQGENLAGTWPLVAAQEIQRAGLGELYLRLLQSLF